KGKGLLRWPLVSVCASNDPLRLFWVPSGCTLQAFALGQSIGVTMKRAMAVISMVLGLAACGGGGSTSPHVHFVPDGAEQVIEGVWFEGTSLYADDCKLIADNAEELSRITGIKVGAW